MKWDGYRAQAVKRGATITLASRNLKNITSQYPTVASAVAAVRAKDAVLDGEIVALDATGRPSFQALHHAQTDGLSVVYYAFDLLYLDGRDLTREPLEKRRAALRGVAAGSPVLLSDALPGSREDIERAVKSLGLEGIVAKRKRSPYAVGRRGDTWIKVRFARRQELVIGGFKPAGPNFDSILVGYYDARRDQVGRATPERGSASSVLLSAGKVRNGFTPVSRAQLFSRLEGLVVKRCPFTNLPSLKSSHWGEGITAAEMLELWWVKPVLVAEVSFTEWTRDGSLRHGAFVGLRNDKSPREVRKET